MDTPTNLTFDMCCFATHDIGDFLLRIGVFSSASDWCDSCDEPVDFIGFFRMCWEGQPQSTPYLWKGTVRHAKLIGENHLPAQAYTKLIDLVLPQSMLIEVKRYVYINNIICHHGYFDLITHTFYLRVPLEFSASWVPSIKPKTDWLV